MCAHWTIFYNSDKRFLRASSKTDYIVDRHKLQSDLQIIVFCDVMLCSLVDR